MKMEKWHYAKLYYSGEFKQWQVDYSGLDGDPFPSPMSALDALNKLGEEGWELVAVTDAVPDDITDHESFYLKKIL